ncbi:electron transfer flavoprotein subunit alpha/FixB family protein [Marinobacterium sp. D7]|uniref:electron transfer flavoprotein subunit alpha/FixB family protein n=1 Tax=Marinobacterium ramblicola TaxID=2849041 RepID=UPI001C2D54F4|nr:electron transfer flavoprotein subunit alpha/FixB family protein [Marinobacterium ramblicola]MBV1789729.1 electron transfer flavoprotein subunit alpha/FixB family protein [Marinobacterium ramblicola]
MTTLLIADHDNTRLSSHTAKALTAALKLGEVHLLVAGHDVSAVANEAVQLAGVSKVLVADHPELGHQLAESMANTILALAKDYSAIVAAATTTGKNTLPRVAAQLDVMQLSEIIEVVSEDTFKRPIYAGNAIQTVRSHEAVKVITVRTASFDSTSRTGSAPIERIDAMTGDKLSAHLADQLSKSDRPELASAKVIISGGRALGSADRFKEVILPVADKLGAAVGASRAAVDAGYAPNDWQVGQTGKIVSPELYIACGISGAIQHLAGMKDSKVIVAINSDEDAPIFQVADYQLVADLFEALPELERSL